MNKADWMPNLCCQQIQFLLSHPMTSSCKQSKWLDYFQGAVYLPTKSIAAACLTHLTFHGLADVLAWWVPCQTLTCTFSQQTPACESGPFGRISPRLNIKNDLLRIGTRSSHTPSLLLDSGIHFDSLRTNALLHCEPKSRSLVDKLRLYVHTKSLTSKIKIALCGLPRILTKTCDHKYTVKWKTWKHTAHVGTRIGIPIRFTGKRRED